MIDKGVLYGRVTGRKLVVVVQARRENTAAPQAPHRLVFNSHLSLSYAVSFFRSHRSTFHHGVQGSVQACK